MRAGWSDHHRIFHHRYDRMKLIASETISPRNTTIVGLSAALGVGISQSSSALSQFPESITIIFGKTPVVIATIMAVLLNLILPQENTDQ